MLRKLSKNKADKERQYVDYLRQIRASRQSLKPQESPANHYRTEANFLLNKKVQSTASKKLAEARKPDNPHANKKHKS
jgi:hypothetical protein